MSEENRSSDAPVPDVPEPPTFDEAVRTGVQRLQDAIVEFEATLARIPDEAYREGEAQVLEATAAEVERLIEAGQIDFEAAAYDSEAWYPIVEDLQQVASKLYDAIFLMRDVEKRLAGGDTSSGSTRSKGLPGGAPPAGTCEAGGWSSAQGVPGGAHAAGGYPPQVGGVVGPGPGEDGEGGRGML